MSPRHKLLMSLSGAQYCERGEQCTQYYRLREPAKVRKTSNSKICEPCRTAESEAKLEAELRELQRDPPAVDPFLRYREFPLEAHLRHLKRNLVAQVRRRRGSFWEAVERVRSYWQLDDVSSQLPPESQDILLPPALAEPGDLSELYAVWSDHPHLLPLSGGPRDHPCTLMGITGTARVEVSSSRM